MHAWLQRCLAACVLLAAARDSGATPVTNVRTIPRADLTSAAVGGLGAGTGTITISGVTRPAIKALLYWHGIDNSGTGQVYDNATVSFGGNSITGVSLGDATTNCWGNGASRTFRADVTALVPGSTTTTVSTTTTL